MAGEFVHLRVKSAYSLLEGAIRAKEHRRGNTKHFAFDSDEYKRGLTLACPRERRDIPVAGIRYVDLSPIRAEKVRSYRAL